ncbi:MAG: hypothetical protein E6Q89_05375 [Bacteroidia bacterium]|nr:MAG: hypothetical protein E6Q89_05375 [Bacteroidia bacterium]
MKNKLSIVGLFFAFILIANFDAGAQRRSSVYRGGVNRSRTIVRHQVNPHWGWSRPRLGLSLHFGYPGFGMSINSMPYGYRRVITGGAPFFYYNNRYYRSLENGDYEATETPLGATVNALPAGARKLKVDGETYYEFRGTYYLPSEDTNGDRLYIVVGVDGELNTNEALSNQANTKFEQNEKLGVNEIPNVETTMLKVKVGDRFDILPRNSKVVYKDNVMYYESMNGVLYKKITTDDKIEYEVVKVP